MFDLPHVLPHIPKHVTGITHPNIADMYIKHHSIGRTNKIRKILIIETNARPQNTSPNQDYAEHDSYLIDLLIDLEDLKKQVEAKVGKLDEIDIREATIN